MKDELLNKNSFNIRDLATIVKKETQTIRSWETKGIIPKPSLKSENGWREYTKEDLANTLEAILNYSWQRKVIKNESEIQYIIDYLRGNASHELMSLMDE
jgi:DNA-binding transcriptional MerR regulator